MKYTQSQWDSEIGWRKVPEKYKYNMKENNDELQSHTSETTRTHNRNDKS